MKSVAKDAESGIIKHTDTKHAEDRKAERGVTDSEIQNALNDPLYTGEIITDSFGRKSRKYIGESATVCVNPDTKAIITVWRTGRRTAQKYRKGD